MEEYLFYITYEVALQIAEKHNIKIDQIKSQHIINKEFPCRYIGKNRDLLHCWIPSTILKESGWFKAEIHFFIELKRLKKKGRIPSTMGYIKWWQEYVKAMSEEEIEVKAIIINSMYSLYQLLNNRIKKL